jgi:hypothetical protein
MRHIGIVVVTVLILGLTYAAGWVQAGQVRPQVPIVPTVVRGNDLGFRIEGHNGNRTTGRLVLWNGAAWVETEFVIGPRPATGGGR